MTSRVRYVALLFALLASLFAPLIAAEYYKLEGIKRIDQDLYRARKILVETRYCYHYSFGETAILKYEGSGEYSGSKIIWEDESACDVRKVISE